MLDMVRNGLARVAGIRAFFTVHQPADPALVVLSAKLDAGDHRAAELIRSRGEHEVEGRTATEHAKKARRRLGRGLLPLFARAGLAAARTKPELLASFRSLSPRVTNLDFAAAAGSLIEATKANLEVLADHGVSAKMVEEAAALLEQYVTKTALGLQSRNSRVVGTKELRVVVTELLDIVARMDRYHRHQFADDPQMMAGWESARTMAGPLNPRESKGESVSGTPAGEGSAAGTGSKTDRAA